MITPAENFPADLGERIDRLATAAGIPGLAIAATSAATGPVTHVFGSEPDGRAVDAHTPFSVASSGKHATSCAVLALAQRGRLSIDDPIGRYLADVPETWADRRVIDLMHHTSGLPDYLAHGPDAAIPATRAAFFERYRTLVPAYEAGEAWCYSNTNYILLGLLVQQMAATNYPDALRELLLDPSACTEVVAGGPDIPSAPNDAGRYAAIEAGWRSQQICGDGDLVLSAGGALDWHRVLTGETVLSPASSDALVAPRRMASGRDIPYGKGWFLDHMAGLDTHWHGGHFGGWSSFFYRAPTVGAALYLMTNIAPGHTRAQRSIAQVALEALAPGTTPLSLGPSFDHDRALTRAARDALLRPSGPPNGTFFADELRTLIERVPGPRSVINLWAGAPPHSFECVEETTAETTRMRRYRLAYPDRIEHVQVGYTKDDRIYWAWPL